MVSERTRELAGNANFQATGSLRTGEKAVTIKAWNSAPSSPTSGASSPRIPPEPGPWTASKTPPWPSSGDAWPGWAAGATCRRTGATAPETDGRGRWASPGFVDPHTHLLFGGDRSQEFNRRLHGVTYAQIAAEGGGIRETVRATRQAEHWRSWWPSGRSACRSCAARAWSTWRPRPATASPSNPRPGCWKPMASCRSGAGASM